MWILGLRIYIFNYLTFINKILFMINPFGFCHLNTPMLLHFFNIHLNLNLRYNYWDTVMENVDLLLAVTEVLNYDMTEVHHSLIVRYEFLWFSTWKLFPKSIVCISFIKYKSNNLSILPIYWYFPERYNFSRSWRCGQMAWKRLLF